MSIESAREFRERVRNDEDFRKKVEEIATAEEGMEFARGAGFDFSKEDLDVVMSELSDEDLEGVAGGSALSDFATGFVKGFTTVMTAFSNLFR